METPAPIRSNLVIPVYDPKIFPIFFSVFVVWNLWMRYRIIQRIFHCDGWEGDVRVTGARVEIWNKPAIAPDRGASPNLLLFSQTRHNIPRKHLEDSKWKFHSTSRITSREECINPYLKWSFLMFYLHHLHLNRLEMCDSISFFIDSISFFLSILTCQSC